MPLKSFLKILFCGLLALTVLLVVSAQFSLTKLPSDTDKYQAYQHTAKECFEAAQSIVVGSIELLGELDGEGWIALFTGILAVATIFLWIATQRIFVHGRRSTERQLRAYVSYTGGNFVNVDDEAHQNNLAPQCNLVLINQGQTPAKNVKIHRRSWAMANPKFSVNPNVFFQTPFDENVTEGTIKFFAPKAEIPVSIRLSRRLDAVEFEQFKTEGIMYRAVFTISYEDVFGEPHFYKFGRSFTRETVKGGIYEHQWDGETEDEDSD